MRISLVHGVTRSLIMPHLALKSDGVLFGEPSWLRSLMAQSKDEEKTRLKMAVFTTTALCSLGLKRLVFNKSSTVEHFQG